MECAVCADSFNKTTRRQVECLYCAYKACKSCVARFLLENTVIPKCMSCKTEWNMEFVRSNLPRSFMDNEYKTHQKGAIQVEAEANLGAYQAFVQRENRLEELKEMEWALLDEERRIKEALMELRNERMRVRIHGVIVEETRAERNFFMACPDKDCRGRLSTAYKCGLCSHFFCRDCHGDKGLERDGEHECNKDEVETVKMLMSETKPCPKCHIRIHKTQGCDQMWCTQCHTCFSWRSGNILNGLIHNPHFYEWQRQQGGGQAPRVAGDIPCGGFPNLPQIVTKFVNSGLRKNNPYSVYIEQIHRLATHLQDITMPAVHDKFNRRADYQRDAGVKYLQGKVDKDKWVDLLYRADRQTEKHRRYYQVLETLVFNLSEILRQFVHDPNKSPAMTQIECERLLEFANVEIRKMNKQFNSCLRELKAGMNTTRL